MIELNTKSHSSLYFGQAFHKTYYCTLDKLFTKLITAWATSTEQMCYELTHLDGCDAEWEFSDAY